MNCVNNTESKIFFNKASRFEVNGPRNISSIGRGKTLISRGQTHGFVKVCTYCRKFRHTVNTCFKRYGYLLGFKFRNFGILNINVATAEVMNSGSIFEKVPQDHHSSSNMNLTLKQFQRLLS